MVELQAPSITNERNRTTMITTALLIYVAAVYGFEITAWLLIATFLIDISAWEAISNSFEAWATGTTEDQKFWEDEE